MNSIEAPRWYAFYVTARHEKKVLTRIQKLDVTVYLPIIRKWNQWSDRKKEVETPLIPGYIFCYIKINDRLLVLDIPGVNSIVKIGGKFTRIPDEQIETLKIFVQNSETLKAESRVSPGDRVRVAKGVFSGAIGTVKKESGSTRLVLSIENLGVAYSVAVKKTDLQRITVEK